MTGALIAIVFVLAAWNYTLHTRIDKLEEYLSMTTEDTK